jgi:hypothetical protein
MPVSAGLNVAVFTANADGDPLSAAATRFNISL